MTPLPYESEEEEIIPTHNDVLRGRGNGPQQHAGNQQYRMIVEQYRPAYAGLKKTIEKQAMAERVWKEVKSMNPPGRFLIQSKKDRRWSIEDESNSMSKIKQALREKKQETLEKQGSNFSMQLAHDSPLDHQKVEMDGNYTIPINFDEDDSSTGSLEISDRSITRMVASGCQHPPMPALQNVTQGALDNDLNFAEMARPPVPPTNDTTPRQGNARHPNAQDGSTPIMKTRFLPRELSLGRGPGGLGGGLSSTSMRGDMSLGLESSMGSMMITDESFQRLSEGEIDFGTDVDPIKVFDDKIEYEGSDENKRKGNFLSRDPILERAKDSSNTTMGFIDTSVGLIDVSMKSLDFNEDL